MSDIHDRGTIKWTSMMLPEHQKLLNDYWKSTEHKKKPVLDEQEIEEINMKLQMAIHNDLTVEIKYFMDHDFHTIKGKLKKVDVMDKYIQLNYDRIKLQDIIDVNID